MKKRFITFILSLIILFISSVGYSTKADIYDYKLVDEGDKKGETGLVTEDENSKEAVDKNIVHVSNEEELIDILGEVDEDGISCCSLDEEEMNTNLPDSVDNSKEKYFPAIEDQVGPSCVCYSLVYYVMTYEYNKYHNSSANIEENIMSPIWAYALTNRGEYSSSSIDRCYDLLTRNGVASIKDVPLNYKGKDKIPYLMNYNATGNVWENALANRVRDIYRINFADTNDNTPITNPKDEDLELIKSALSKGHILSFGTEFFKFRYETISSNPEVPENYKYQNEYIVSKCDNYGSGGHQMVIVGYNDNIWVDINSNGIVEEGEKGAFKVANSWGDDYRNDGFIWISYDALNKVSSVNNDAVNNTERIEAFQNYEVYGITIDDTSNDEGYYLEVDLNSSLRNTVKVSVSDTDGEVNDIILSPHNGKDGGDYGFDGTTSATDGKFVYNLSNYDKRFTKDYILNKGLRITISDTKNDDVSLLVKDIALIDRKNGTRISYLDSAKKLNKSILEIVTKEVKLSKVTDLKAKVNNENNVELSWQDNTNTKSVKYQILRDGKLIGCTSDKSFIDASNVNDEYTYYVRAIDSNGNISLLEGVQVKNNYCKIYYKNDNYNNANIYYKVGENAWTTAPGIKMNKSLNRKGYFEYTINLNDYPENVDIIACFNNGSGSWDNNANKNYLLKKGIYTLEDGVISEATEELKFIDISVNKESPQAINEIIRIEPLVTGGSGEYSGWITVSSQGSSGFSTYISDLYQWKPTKVGEYTINITIYDKVTGEEVSKEIIYSIRNKDVFKIDSIDFNKQSPQPVNSTIRMKINTNADNTGNEISYALNVTDINGKKCNVKFGNNKNEFIWQDSPNTGKYYINVTAKNKDTNEEDNYQYVYEIEDNELNVEYFKVYKGYGNNEITTTKASDSYHFEAHATGGSGTNYEYKYGYYLNGEYFEFPNVYSYYYAPYLEKEGDYVLVCNVTDSKGNTASATCNLNVMQGDYYLDYPIIDKSLSNICLNDVFNIQLKSKFAVGTEEFKLVDLCNGNEKIIQDFSENKTIKYVAFIPGYHTLRIDGKDSRGVISSQYVYFDVKTDPIIINSFTTDKTEVALGEAINIKSDVSGGYGELSYCIYALDEESNITTIKDYGTENSVSWTPSKEGTYGIYLEVKDEAGKYQNSSISNIIVKNLSTTTIYYNGYDNPYIHYRIGNGEWTKVPGVKMEASSDIEGYGYKITIDLADSEGLIACFNNGNGSWDSNNGKNYSFGKGYYTYSNGIVTKIEEPKPQPLSIKDINVNNGSVNKENDLITLVKDKEGVIKVNSIGGSGKYTYNSELLFNGSVVGSSNTEEIKFTPDSLDKTYTLKVTITDSLKETITKTYTVNVEEKASNQTTIYYRGYDNPYIHYKIGDGEWTKVPGVKMEASSDIEGYGYKITIDLADAERLTACFNNGNGSWDSNNGNNYCFGVGTYTYSNGQINKIK